MFKFSELRCRIFSYLTSYITMTILYVKLPIRDVSIENSEQKTTVTKFYFLDTIKLLRNIFSRIQTGQAWERAGDKKTERKKQYYE